ncbi:voltage-dependent calcium channel gamma-like subunit [Esox lucius]|uniref:Transmembrane protein 37 n=1 Tax=Esox lucius TaxID=8010 RepID=A0A6Q2XNB6_ESOLU|nr:voltage-dependent calcium channel gamma-like subunit [Esox lucius]
MTAIQMKLPGGAHRERKSQPLFLEVLIRSLIILCTALAIVLSSIAVCDGYWLLAGGRRMFGLWNFCTWEAAVEPAAPPNCTTYRSESGVQGVALSLCRSVVSLAVVGGIFGLELLVMSQASEGQDSRRRWSLGSALLLVAAALSAAGVALFAALLWQHASPLGFTLTFWCQFTAAFLLFLNGTAARHVHHMAQAGGAPGGLGDGGGQVWKCQG